MGKEELPFAKYCIGSPENLAEWEAWDEYVEHEPWRLGFKPFQNHCFAVLCGRDDDPIIVAETNKRVAEYIIVIHNAHLAKKGT